jgi:hypothetical protein
MKRAEASERREHRLPDENVDGESREEREERQEDGIEGW